jgi:hypothetical protein
MIWEQHPAQDRYEEEVFKEFFREALESNRRRFGRAAGKTNPDGTTVERVVYQIKKPTVSCF